MSDPRSGLSRGRQKQNRRSVRTTEVLARWLISVGGIGTIVAVCAVFLFLLWVVKDLFLGAQVAESTRVRSEVAGASPLEVGVDEYRTIAWTLAADGVVRAIRLDGGSTLRNVPLRQPADPPLTAVAKDLDGKGLVLGFADGSVRLASITFTTEFREADTVTGELRKLPPGGIGAIDGGIVQRTVLGQFRIQKIVVDVDEPIVMRPGVPIVRVHRAPRRAATLIAAVDQGGGVALRERTRTEDPFTGEPVAEWGPQVEVPPDGLGVAPTQVMITDLASNLVVAHADGRAARYAIRILQDPKLAEVVDLTSGDVQLTALGLLLGGVTLISGDSTGVVGGWFVVPDPTNDVDGMRLVLAHRFELDDKSPVLTCATSTRARIFAVGTAAGHVHAMFMTSNKRLCDITVRSGEPIAAIAIAPKNDGILVGTSRGLGSWTFEPRHPEATFSSLFGKVWYERYPEPGYAWQSSAGTDDNEAKLSLVPLVFGTVKATFYSMLIGVPLALLAAIYTSEFLSRRWKARVKPVIELMASLPSVVLGFLAALVIAPAVEAIVPALLTALMTVPFAILCAAFVWQALPLRATLRVQALRLPMAAVAMVGGIGLAVWGGPVVERLLFAGDFRAWLDGRVGSGLAAWWILALPFAVITVAILVTTRVNPWIRRATAEMPRGRASLLHLVKFLVGFASCITLSFAFALLLHGGPTLFGASPWDLRSGVFVGSSDVSPFGTFDQRNALIVGFVMGFAIIPIIYTIAEDALSSVPDHLRAASLGAGATPWQTAARVIVPTAMSGLFSACMIGLGRAVGETMIVLMAAGNTPLMSMNVFNGFRTLSANIATELPEAVVNSTHYRTLFLAALVLFAMTFVINTLAETIRQRFRRRSGQL